MRYEIRFSDEHYNAVCRATIPASFDIVDTKDNRVVASADSRAEAEGIIRDELRATTGSK